MVKRAKNQHISLLPPSLQLFNKMSSTISLATINAKIDALLGEVALLRAAANSAPVPVSSTVKTTAAPKQPRKKSDAPPTPWRLFTDRIRGVLAAADFKGKALGVECVQFCASLKDENADFDSWTDELVLARRADWSAPEVSRGEAKHGKGWAKTGERRAAAKAASVTGSVVSGGDADADADGGAALVVAEPKKARKNTWEGLTPEQRAAKVAAMKAGKDAKKAGGSTDSVTESADNTAAVLEAAPSPVLTAAASSSVVVTNAGKAAADSAPVSEFQGVMLGGNRYLVNLANGHCYRREKDGSQGDWAGIFHRTGGKKNGPYIDEAVPEPTDDDGDDGDFRFDNE